MKGQWVRTRTNSKNLWKTISPLFIASDKTNTSNTLNLLSITKSTGTITSKKNCLSYQRRSRRILWIILRLLAILTDAGEDLYTKGDLYMKGPILFKLYPAGMSQKLSTKTPIKVIAQMKMIITRILGGSKKEGFWEDKFRSHSHTFISNHRNPNSLRILFSSINKIILNRFYNILI